MSDHTRFSPWMCSRCGYVMDAASHMREHVTPKEDDLSLCMNCCALYVLHGERWTPATTAERESLSSELRHELFEMEWARRLAGFGDLAKRGGRA